MTHVRVHFLPYLGGEATLNALKTRYNSGCRDYPFADPATSSGLLGLRNSLTKPQLQSHDTLNVCYAILTERILFRLPQSNNGVWLKPLEIRDPYSQVVQLFLGSSVSLDMMKYPAGRDLIPSLLNKLVNQIIPTTLV